MSFRAYAILFCATLGLPLAISCGKRTADKTPEEIQRDHELKLFAETIRTVQERYVDVEQVHIDQIISNSLKGMVASIDPYAVIQFTGNPPSEIIPQDVPLAELLETEWPEIMVLKIYSFHPLMKKHVRNLHNKMRGREPAGILIDGRGATGTDYSAALEICALFLPRETIVGTIIEKQGEVTRSLTTRSPPVWKTNSVIVLIDNQTYGPPELLASALRFYRRATLAGEPSRGVAVVQSPISVTDQWIVMLSTGRVLDPGGKNITGNPLTPDLAAIPDPEEKENVDYIFRRGMSALRDTLSPLN